MLSRERSRSAIALPMPAPLPNLRDVFARRVSIFGPVDIDPAPVAPRGALARCAAALRSVADLLEPQVAR